MKNLPIADQQGVKQAGICAYAHRASSIKVAEAAKVIENTQRNVNIALMNELSIIFNKLSIDHPGDFADCTDFWA